MELSYIHTTVRLAAATCWIELWQLILESNGGRQTKIQGLNTQMELSYIRIIARWAACNILEFNYSSWWLNTWTEQSVFGSPWVSSTTVWMLCLSGRDGFDAHRHRQCRVHDVSLLMTRLNVLNEDVLSRKKLRKCSPALLSNGTKTTRQCWQLSPRATAQN